MRSNAAGKKVSNLTSSSVLLRFEFDDEPLDRTGPLSHWLPSYKNLFFLQTEQKQISFHGLEDCWRTEVFLKHLRPEF